MSRIAQSSVQEVLNRTDAIAVVEDHLRLEKRGGRYWGRCPFHSGGQEKTPSFTVDPDQKLYYCFGCHKGGGIIDFVMEMEKTSYPETIKNLARKFGVELSYEGGGEENENWQEEQSRKEQLFELYRRTALTFSHFLLEKPEGKPALDYLLSRGISIEMIKHFRLGYAPADREWLYPFLQGKGYSPDFLDGSGLFSANYRGMAFFTNRLMFPIADRQGRVVAFGGRAMPDAVQRDGIERAPDRAQPKYINTREIDIYKKGQILYALDLALPEIRRSKTVYLAEGYMDVIALHQAGVTNAAAPCGTAFTDEQAKMLRHWADTAVLVFDSDEAGRQAAAKGIITCRKNGLACSLVNAAPGDGALKDPAEILEKFGADTLTKTMKRDIIDFEHLVAQGKALYDTAQPQGKKQALEMLFPYFDALASQAERDACIAAAADEIRVEKSAAAVDYERWRQTGGSVSKKSNLEEGFSTETVIRMNDELFLLMLVSVNKDLFSEFRAAISMNEIGDKAAKELYVALEECFRNEESGIENLLSRITSPVLRNFVIKRGISPEFKGDEKRDPRKLMEDGIRRVKEKRLRRRLSEIGAELRQKERELGSDVDDLIAEKMFVDAEIRKLEGKTG